MHFKILYYLLEEKKKKNRFGEAYAHFIESKPISYISLLFLSFHFPSIFFPSSLPSSKWNLRKKKKSIFITGIASHIDYFLISKKSIVLWGGTKIATQNV